MSEISYQHHCTGFARLKLYLALSRTPHGLLDMCTPAYAALLWLGAFPPLKVIVLGLITTFAGYTAVYALNDVVDFRSDLKKAGASGFSDAGKDLDAVLVRHPMALGLLSLRAGLIWALAWGALALVGAYLLNPVCVLIFLGGCVLEAIYCLLWRISPFRTLVSGGVKTSGAIAAVFAVDPHPAAGYLIVLFLLFFFWEIGGQNIPNDWVDLEEDQHLKARTIPTRFGLQRSMRIILAALAATLVMNLAIFYFSKAAFNVVLIIISLALGGYLLLLPALRLYKTRASSDAMNLFNRASYYPPALLIVMIIKVLA